MYLEKRCQGIITAALLRKASGWFEQPAQSLAVLLFLLRFKFLFCGLFLSFHIDERWMIGSLMEISFPVQIKFFFHLQPENVFQIKHCVYEFYLTLGNMKKLFLTQRQKNTQIMQLLEFNQYPSFGSFSSISLELWRSRSQVGLCQ